jgi:hypothetical protein
MVEVSSQLISDTSVTFEEQYQLEAGRLRLMKRIVESSSRSMSEEERKAMKDDMKVFNGKNLSDASETLSYVKCPPTIIWK